MDWQPMETAPREEYHYIAARPKDQRGPCVVYWDGDGWWLPEGATFQDDYFLGWSPLPQS